MQENDAMEIFTEMLRSVEKKYIRKEIPKFRRIATKRRTFKETSSMQ